jgi:hypothetical protein
MVQLTSKKWSGSVFKWLKQDGFVLAFWKPDNLSSFRIVGTGLDHFIYSLFFITEHVFGGRVTVTDGDRRLITIMNMSLHNSIYQLWKVRSARSLSSRIDVLLVST